MVWELKETNGMDPFPENLLEMTEVIFDIWNACIFMELYDSIGSTVWSDDAATVLGYLQMFYVSKVTCSQVGLHKLSDHLEEKCLFGSCSGRRDCRRL